MSRTGCPDEIGRLPLDDLERSAICGTSGALCVVRNRSDLWPAQSNWCWGSSSILIWHAGSGFDDGSRLRQEPDVSVPATGNQEEQLGARANTFTVRKSFLHKNTSAATTVSLLFGWHVVSTNQVSVIISNYRQKRWRKSTLGIRGAERWTRWNENSQKIGFVYKNG